MVTLKRGLTIVLMAAILFGGGYWFYDALAVCKVPLSYRIGSVDSRFDISPEAVRNAVSGAESLWEDGTDRNLFTYSPEGELVVNFVYDERQAKTEKQEEFQELLDQKEGMSDTVKSEYEKLVSNYEDLRQAYENDVAAYEKKLTAYNREVSEWNTRGGAPKDVFERLEKTQDALGREEERLNTRSRELNTLVSRLNVLGSQGNSLVSDYNSLVTKYNDTFAEGGEFTQGEYSDGVITIYEFSTEEELLIVLAHELGHALGIGHVEGEDSFMYHLMGAQDAAGGLTEIDRGAFMTLCGDAGTMADTLVYLRETLLSLLARIK
jgi:Matrixin